MENDNFEHKVHKTVQKPHRNRTEATQKPHKTKRTETALLRLLHASASGTRNVGKYAPGVRQIMIGPRMGNTTGEDDQG